MLRSKATLFKILCLISVRAPLRNQISILKLDNRGFSARNYRTLPSCLGHGKLAVFGDPTAISLKKGGDLDQGAEMLKFDDFPDKNVVFDSPSGTDRRNARV